MKSGVTAFLNNMKEIPFRIITWLIHFITAYRKGHGIHSEYIYRFLEQAVYVKARFSHFEKMQKLRNELKKNETCLDREHWGAGSQKLSEKKASVKDIYRVSSSPVWKSELYFRMLNYLKVKHVLELGTNLGITSLTLSGLGKNVEIDTVEGSKSLYEFAKESAKKLSIENIRFHHSSFEDYLNTEQNIKNLEAVIIDGNHRGDALTKYVDFFIQYCPHLQIIIADDITWSKDMYEHWKKLSTRLPEGWIHLDFYYVGILLKTPLMQKSVYFRIYY